MRARSFDVFISVMYTAPDMSDNKTALGCVLIASWDSFKAKLHD